MRMNKKFSLYFFIAFIFISFGSAYVVIAKNAWRSKDAKAESLSENKKKDSQEKTTASAVPIPTSESTVADTASNPDVSTVVPATTTASVSGEEYPVHKNISTTYFWAGEEADADNKNISNLPSAWDEDWVKHFGGIDTPDKRNGYNPAGFTPKENPFYFALPYNDFNEKGKQKNDAVALAMWSQGKTFGAQQSMCKNQWIKITKNGKTVYAQWEDVGPFGEDDKAYVFGNATPVSKENKHAGLDVSPAVHDYLSLGDIDKTDWQFVDATDVPDGPWKKIMTTSQIFWR